MRYSTKIILLSTILISIIFVSGCTQQSIFSTYPVPDNVKEFSVKPEDLGNEYVLDSEMFIDDCPTKIGSQQLNMDPSLFSELAEHQACVNYNKKFYVEWLGKNDPVTAIRITQIEINPISNWLSALERSLYLQRTSLSQDLETNTCENTTLNVEYQNKKETMLAYYCINNYEDSKFIHRQLVFVVNNAVINVNGAGENETQMKADMIKSAEIMANRLLKITMG